MDLKVKKPFQTSYADSNRTTGYASLIKTCARLSAELILHILSPSPFQRQVLTSFEHASIGEIG